MRYRYYHPNPLRIYWQVRSMSLTYRIYMPAGIEKMYNKLPPVPVPGDTHATGILSQGTWKPCAGAKTLSQKTNDVLA